jgi:hypothetical protein
MRKLVRRVVFGLLVLLALLGAVAALSWRSPAFYPAAALPPAPAAPLTAEQYAAVHEDFVRPYVVRCERATGGAVLLYGATHTKDPGDPQIADLRRRWAEFRPTVALVEGRPGAPLAALADPVARFGEGGAVLALARRDGLRFWTWEPTREAEVAAQLERFPAERVALFYVLRPYVSDLRHGKPADPEAAVEPYRRERTALPGLAGTLPSMAAIDAVWRRDFAGLPDWRDTSDADGWPGYLAALADRANAYRDEHFARVVAALAGRGERVFASAGSSHAVTLEPAVAALCGEPWAGTRLADGTRRAPAAGG